VPELPEVETVVSDLQKAGICGKAICAAHVGWPRTIATHSPRRFHQALQGRRIDQAWRRAKYIVLGLDNGQSILIHLRMTGRLNIEPAREERSRHEHVVIDFDDGSQLRFHDTRKFGRWSLVEDAAEALAHLGPEPMSKAFTASLFAGMLKGRSRALKPLLLDQSFVAGLGNIYVDEALWESHLHPLQNADTLSAEQAADLRKAIRLVLRRGLRNMGTTLGTGAANFYSVGTRRGRNQDQLKVFRRQGEACPRCGTVVERLIVGQRSTHICPACQVLKKSSRG
jgi:formamidopyrimidine-DNA glycosylase